MKLRVMAYAGYKADERPVRFTMGAATREVREMVDRWYGEGNDYFKVIADDGNLYLLRHDRETDEWELTMTETLAKD
jgi:hypothetical protein